MIRETGAKSAPHHYSDAELTWVQEHMAQLRQSVSGQHLLLQSLGIGFALGLITYAAGYALKASATTEPFKFMGDLLYTLGWALWTGVVVAVMVEIIPRAKQRQVNAALDTYEAALREKARSGSDQPSKSNA